MKPLPVVECNHMRWLTPAFLFLPLLAGCGGSGGGTEPPNPPPVFTGARLEGDCRYFPDPWVTCTMIVQGQDVQYQEQSGTGWLPGTFKNGVLHVANYNLRVNLEWTGTGWRMWYPERLEVFGK